MALKIPYTPLEDGYGAVLNQSVTGFRTAGGPGRLRQSLFGSVSEVNVQWSLDSRKYNHLMFMIREQLGNGTIPFSN